MPTIATIQRRRGALAIQLEGDPDEHVLAREPVEARALYEGVSIADEEWAELRSVGRRRLALERALTALSRRAHTERELRDRLAKQFDAPEVDAAVERMTDLGYLDDARRAEEFVTARQRRYGPRRLRQELMRRGVDRDTVEAATGDLDDFDPALTLARQRLGRLRRLDPPQQRRRLYGYLHRRGFAYDTIQRAIAAVLDDEAQDGDPDSTVD